MTEEEKKELEAREWDRVHNWNRYYGGNSIIKVEGRTDSDPVYGNGLPADPQQEEN